MTIEGIGVVRPKAIRTVIPDFVREWLARIAEKRNRFRMYSGRSDSWGRGLTDSPVLKGLIGEWCVHNYIEKLGITAEWDAEEDIKTGDGGSDITAAGQRIQVKTGAMMIRRITEDRSIVPMNFDIAVFCRLDGNTCDLLGWIYKAKLLRLEKSKRGPHWNIVLGTTDIEPMTRLKAALS